MVRKFNDLRASTFVFSVECNGDIISPPGIIKGYFVTLLKNSKRSIIKKPMKYSDYSVLSVRFVLMRLSRPPPTLHQKSGQQSDAAVNRDSPASF